MGFADVLAIGGPGTVLNKVLTACEEEEIAVAGVQSTLLKLLLLSLRLAWVLAEGELWLAAVASVV